MLKEIIAIVLVIAMILGLGLILAKLAFDAYEHIDALQRHERWRNIRFAGKILSTTDVVRNYLKWGRSGDLWYYIRHSVKEIGATYAPLSFIFSANFTIAIMKRIYL